MEKLWNRPMSTHTGCPTHYSDSPPRQQDGHQHISYSAHITTTSDTLLLPQTHYYHLRHTTTTSIRRVTTLQPQTPSSVHVLHTLLPQTHYYHLYLPRHNATTSDTELTPDCCPNTQHTYPIVIFLQQLHKNTY